MSLRDALGRVMADWQQARREAFGQHALVPRSSADRALGYLFPPLWGNDSFNDGAGMARLSTMANFVHFNMPHGTDYLNTRLTVEQSWDVSAICCRSRGRKNPASIRISPIC